MNSAEQQSVVVSIVRKAGERLMRYFESGEFVSHSKGGVDFATEADDEIDQFLRDELLKQFPDSQFLTEETASDDYLKFKNTENLWVIDPIDGTLNFSRGIEHFAISVALVNNARVDVGVVFLPAEKKLYTAIRDQKEAFCNGKPLQVSKISSLETAFLATDWAWNMERRREIYKKLSNVLFLARGVKCVGSAASDLSGLAAGKIDGYFISGIKPWDMAAATLFIEKAGGKITKIDGSKWDVFDPEILASNGLLHSKLVSLLNK